MSDVQLPLWVQKINSGGVGDKNIHRMFFYMMKELHLSFDDLLNMPLPTILVLSQELSDHNKREEKSMKKSK